MHENIEKILHFLNKVKIRATYGAVGEALELHAHAFGTMLGERRPEASWIVNAETGMPTGYEPKQCHPDVSQDPHIIRTGMELCRRMAGLLE